MPLSFADIADLFVRLRRHRNKTKQHLLKCTSGDNPETDWSLADEGAVSEHKVPLVQEDTFTCRDGVDVPKLLRLVRATLFEEAQTIGANVLVDEQWSCTIHGPRHDGRTFKVHIRYDASAARSHRPEPQSPVALERARGIPGLMTILERED